MIRPTFFSIILSLAVASGPAFCAPSPPSMPVEVKGRDGVKTYLLAVIKQITAATTDLKKASTEYTRLVVDHGGTPTVAAAAEPKHLADLIHRMRDAYERIDSFGYEYVEGIVAGVPSLNRFDALLDAGVPKKDASPTDTVADLVLKAGDLTIDHEGSLNNYLIEPTVFGTNERFTVGTATLPGFDKPVGLPNPKLIEALADFAVDSYAGLDAAAKAWQPSEKDLFCVVTAMTPTLADYFEDWKESKKSGYAPGGRFVAVSRISDMRGIMSSTRLAWLAVADDVKAKDAALSDKVTTGYSQILSFIDDIDSREQKQPLTPEAIDALGSQAKEKADTLTVQANQAATLMNIEVPAAK